MKFSTQEMHQPNSRTSSTLYKHSFEGSVPCHATTALAMRPWRVPDRFETMERVYVGNKQQARLAAEGCL
jgi:hypothetical protein